MTSMAYGSRPQLGTSLAGVVSPSRPRIKPTTWPYTTGSNMRLHILVVAQGLVLEAAHAQTAWIEAAPHLAHRALHAMAMDSARGESVLFGGLDQSSGH